MVLVLPSTYDNTLPNSCQVLFMPWCFSRATVSGPTPGTCAVWATRTALEETEEDTRAIQRAIASLGREVCFCCGDGDGGNGNFGKGVVSVVVGVVIMAVVVARGQRRHGVGIEHAGSRRVMAKVNRNGMHTPLGLHRGGTRRYHTTYASPTRHVRNAWMCMTTHTPWGRIPRPYRH